MTYNSLGPVLHFFVVVRERRLVVVHLLVILETMQKGGYAI